MSLTSAIGVAKRNAHNHGCGAALYDVGIRLTNRLLPYRRLQCLVIQTPDHRYTTLPAPFRYARLQASDLMPYAQTPEYELSPEFLLEAENKGDECLAIFHCDTLASYGWYSGQPTRISSELELDFDQNYRYMYKGFTLHSYRGHRLHAIGMTLALASYRSEGRRGLLSYVEAQNFDSLKSCFRMGYRTCGSIRYFKLRNAYRISATSECAGYGLRLYQLPSTILHSRYHKAHAA